MKSEHNNTRLAESNSVIIERCECGNAFHLHIGWVVMRLPKSALEELYETLGEALVRQAMATDTGLLRAASLRQN